MLLSAPAPLQSIFKTPVRQQSDIASTLVTLEVLKKQQPLRYLEEHRKVLYTDLLTSGRLNSYLADIDLQASERLERLTEQLKQTEGITEQLKAENAMKWVQKMNNIRHRAEEIVYSEIIYT